MEWNNHPFEKDTPVRTFGSRSELAAWDAENCDRCIKHDECELCDAITAAYIGDGRVPLWVAKRIGCLYDPLYLSARLESTCRERMNSAFCLQICGERGNTESGCKCTDFFDFLRYYDNE